MLRNHTLFGVTAIADRGGLSLYTRVLKDEISDAAEFRGAFYAWTPSVVRPVVGRVWGHTAKRPAARRQYCSG